MHNSFHGTKQVRLYYIMIRTQYFNNKCQYGIFSQIRMILTFKWWIQLDVIFNLFIPQTNIKLKALTRAISEFLVLVFTLHTNMHKSQTTNTKELIADVLLGPFFYNFIILLVRSTMAGYQNHMDQDAFRSYQLKGGNPGRWHDEGCREFNCIIRTMIIYIQA